ncbi:T9SS outer membrane translocon Sov/SprA [Spirosoma sordidisoli]|uniref:Cell surface protein SprA n=1 Tax=Spirosoma sordidisoli TaxID=2502893 RepID=A0A4Q2UQV0_9BACT|nr:cell surface protein SprA [Spirosoma sordidisoli]RYC71924.1 cell surface protein SprA [Spirosoma sordidisoli]
MVNPYFVHNFTVSTRFLTASHLLFVSREWILLVFCLVLGMGTIFGQDQPAAAPARRGGAGRRQQQAAADSARADARRRAIARADSIKQAVQNRTDSIRAARSANRRPTINWPDRRATRFSERPSKSPFILRDPKGVSTDFRLSPDGRVAVTERVQTGVSLSGAPAPNSVQGRTDGVPAPGISTPSSATTTPGVGVSGAVPGLALPPSQYGLPYRPAETIPFSTYNQLQNQRVEQSIWREYGARRDGQSALSGRGLVPKLELPPIIDRLFGGSQIDFKPNGFVTLDFGYLYQFIDNPVLPVRQRRNGNFLFNEQISINFNGKIGEKLGVMANFDTKASFNFENALKVNYRPGGSLPGIGTGQGLPGMPSLPGLPNAPTLPGVPGVNGQAPGLPAFQPQNESILQGLEVGNISWAVNSQLIPGVQNLFGIKSQLRFGKLNATVVASQQRSRKSEIVLRGGTSNRPFELRADQYDENRHFFLSQFFRSNYEASLRTLPQVTSGVNVTRVEVYVTNRTNTTETLRNIVGFQDLGEGNPYSQNNPNLQPFSRNTRTPSDNRANGLFDRLTSNANNRLRQVDQTNEALVTDYQLTKGTDFDLLRGAKRLTDREFKLQPELGYISLVTPLRNDEILAVSYEYTYQGRRYKVGELTEDYQARRNDEVLVLKLLKSATLRNNLQLPMWNLMMKNIYSLNNAQISRQGFQLRIVYKDDVTGIDNPNLQEGRRLQNRPLVQVFNMDRLNQQLDAQPDGNFDYVENITVDPRYGKIIFPVLEPFGSFLSRQFDADEDNLRSKYVFDQLYRTTLADAQQLADRNKFFLRGSFQSGNGAEVQLPYGVNEQSVQVTAGGVPMMPGADYVFESQTGRLRIINESVTNSGREIRISFEQPDLFQNQIRTLIGTRLDYLLTPDINFGLTAMHMRETPAGFLTRVAIGNEPVNNSILGLHANYRKDSPGLTRLLDGLPLVQTKEISTIQASAEVAQLFPGTNPRARGDSYLDDFEAARTIFDLTRQPTRWRLGATPQQFPQGSFQNPLESAYNRARISVYSVDPSLYTPGLQGAVSNVDPDEVKNYVYERYFLPTDLFPGRSPRPVQLPESILDVAYFPSERGMYNYNPNLKPDGTLNNDPRRNFGAVTRAIASDNDFDNANVENLTFWLMDPFVQGENGKVRGSADDSKNQPNSTGGRLVFNLGDISEDVVKDSRYTFENGFPANGSLDSTRNGTVESTPWGRAPKQQFVTNAFQSGGRDNQDIGLDGLTSRPNSTPGVVAEQQFFKSYLDAVLPRVTDPEARASIEQDPSGDDFRFYLGEEADRQKYIVARYKYYMGMENNSPENTSTNQFLTPASTTLPDIEDLNADNTINDNEAYYEYEVNLRPDQLEVGRGYIVDKVTVPTDGVGTVTWYQYRIPIREYLRKVGNINGFKSIRFARMYLTDFDQPVVLRFAQLQMEANQYRKYLGDLNQRGLQEVPEPYDANFTVSTVNVEENSSALATQAGGNKYVYSVPPGYQRDRDYTQVNTVELNEQSMRLSVTNLRDGDSRGAFRNVNFDLLFRKQLKMFIHMHGDGNENVNEQVSAFVRLGTDYTDNYYEIEIPRLQATPEGLQSPEVVWPSANELDIALEELTNLKTERNRQLTRRTSLPFTLPSSTGRYILTVVGNPDLSSVQSVMIGVRNPRQPGDGEGPKTFTIWVNELRANGYDQQAGMAAIGSVNMKLADLATVTASGRITTFGFGGVQTRIGERARETTKEFGLSSAVSVDKFLPANWGLRIPMYVNYDYRNVDPHFDPLDPDVPLDNSLSTLPEGLVRDSYRRMVQDNTTRRGLNFSNVRKVKTSPNAKTHFWDVENFAFTYAFNDTKRSNILTDEFLQRQQRGGIAYTFSGQPKAFEPFRNKASFEAPYLRWLKDFNLTLLPSLVSIRSDLDRSFVKTQLRSSDLTTNGIPAQFEKYFLFNRYYDLTWNLTRSLVLTYRSQANSIIDEPAGDINSQAKRDSIFNSLKRLGRLKNFVQDIRATYRLPLDKIPLLDWIAADAVYGVGYQFQANSFGIADTLGVPFGNVVRNNRERGITGRVDLIRLYNKIRYLRFANTPAPVRKNFARNPGDIEEIQRSESRVLKNFTRALLTVRGINFQYTVQESTILPGFLPTPRYFGVDQNNAPGLGFVLGSQDRSIQYRAAERGWLAPSTVQNTAFQQNLTKKFNARTTLEPFKDFRMQVEWRLDRTDAYQEFFRPGSQGGPFETQSPVRNGQFSMSFWSFRTAFIGLRGDNTSPIFDRFESYRQYFIDKLTQANPDRQGIYTATSQDVLIPAFFAAYSGQPIEKAKLSPFYSFPLPNWRIDYNGLSGLDFIRKRFSAFTITHSYTSNYSVGNFISNLEYGAAFVNLAVQGYPLGAAVNQLGQYVPVFAMSTITMSEKFAPMIGVQFQTKSRISGRLEYNQSRDIALNLSNIQVAELSNKDLTASIGFTRQNIRIPFRINGAYKRLKNDLTFSANLTLRDTRAIQRKIDAEQILTAGNVNFQLRPQVSYIVSRRLNVNFYFDRTFNDPLVSNSFRRATTSGGVQVKFNLAE